MKRAYAELVAEALSEAVDDGRIDLTDEWWLASLLASYRGQAEQERTRGGA